MPQATREDLAHSRSVESEVGYLGEPHRIEDGQALHYYADFTGTTNVRLMPRSVRVHDARAEHVTLDRQGIMIARAPSLLRRAEDADTAGAQYLEECSKLIQELTGASAASGGGLHCRFDGVVDPKNRYDKHAARYVHADFSDRAAREFADYAAISVPEGRRYAIYNLWRVLTPPPHSTPLGVCDARSIAAADEVESTVIMAYPDRESIVTETILYRHNPNHRWYYFSHMEPDEVLIFKSHDSDPTRPKRVPHCAFLDASCPAGRPRISVEARVLAVF